MFDMTLCSLALPLIQTPFCSLSLSLIKVFNLEAERRKLQNLVQELRGNVRVFARLRPFLPNDHRR